MRKRRRRSKPVNVPNNTSPVEDTKTEFIDPDFLSFKRVLEEDVNQERSNAVMTSIAALSTAFDRIEGKYNDALYLLHGRLLGLAHFLQDNEDAWIEFCRAELWKDWPASWRPKPDDRSIALVSVIRRFVGKERHLNYRISKWKKVLEPLFNAGMLPSDVPDYIKKHKGVDKLYSNPPQDLVDGPSGSDTSPDEPKFVVADDALRTRILDYPNGQVFGFKARLNAQQDGVTIIELLAASTELIHKPKKRNK